MTSDARPGDVALCQACGAKCCQYVAVQIDEPQTEEDYNEVRWYLGHKDIWVFIDHDDSWYIQFNTPCTYLSDDYRCTIYDARPIICSEHDPSDCEAVEDSECQKFLLKSGEDLEMYLKLKGIEIWWKK